MISARITGLKAAIGQLEKIRKEQERAIRDAFNSTAIDVEREAKLAAPVDTGRLRSDIQKQTEAKDGVMVKAEIFNTVKYAPFVEFGTGTRVSIPDGLEQYADQFRGEGGSARIGMPAQPYLFPAWERNRPKLLDKLRRAL